jgi:hypothetical protein
VKSRSGTARTILLFHIISDRPSKQTRMVGSTLGVYSFGLIFVSARTNKKHHHHGLRHLLGDHNSSSIFIYVLCDICCVIYDLEGSNDANPQDANLTLVGEICFL